MKTTRHDDATREMWRGLDQAWIAVSYILSGLLVWGGAGWLADRAVGTTPWLFIAGAVVGKVAGIWLAYVRVGTANMPAKRGIGVLKGVGRAA